MKRVGLFAVTVAIFPALTVAQRGPSPAPAPVPPAPNILGDMDKAAGDPMIQIRAREEVNKKRYERPATPSELGKSRAARAEEVQAGNPVNDLRGMAIATVTKVEADGVVISTATGSIKVPLESFGVNKRGLLLDVTKDQFDQIVASANAQPKS